MAGNTIASLVRGSVRRKLRRGEVELTYSPFQAIKLKLDERVVKQLNAEKLTEQSA